MARVSSGKRRISAIVSVKLVGSFGIGIVVEEGVFLRSMQRLEYQGEYLYSDNLTFPHI